MTSPFLSGLCILLLSRSGDDSGTPVTNSDSPQEASFVADFGAGSVDFGACLSGPNRSGVVLHLLPVSFHV